MTETTVLDFKLSNTFEEYRVYMMLLNSKRCLPRWESRPSLLVSARTTPKRATVIFKDPKDVLYDIFTDPETKPIVEASGHVYEGTVITRWLA